MVPQSCCAKRSDAKSMSTRQISKTPGQNVVLNLKSSSDNGERTVAEKVGIGAYFQRSAADNGGALSRDAPQCSAPLALPSLPELCAAPRSIGRLVG